MMLVLMLPCRPVAGYVNLCPDSVSTEPHDIQQMHSTIKHEILHALVSTSTNFYAVSTYDRICYNVLMCTLKLTSSEHNLLRETVTEKN